MLEAFPDVRLTQVCSSSHEQSISASDMEYTSLLDMHCLQAWKKMPLSQLTVSEDAQVPHDNGKFDRPVLCIRTAGQNCLGQVQALAKWLCVSTGADQLDDQPSWPYRGFVIAKHLFLLQ